MRIETILSFLVALAIFPWPWAYAGEATGASKAAAVPDAEAKAKADFEAAEVAAKEAEAAVVPFKAALQKADKDYANATKTANTKRQKAADAKNLAGEPGEKELKLAEASVPEAVKTPQRGDQRQARRRKDASRGEGRRASLAAGFRCGRQGAEGGRNRRQAGFCCRQPDRRRSQDGHGPSGRQSHGHRRCQGRHRPDPAK